MTDVVILSRNDRAAEVIELCAKRIITFEECCNRICEMGYKMNSVYEMVRAVEEELKTINRDDRDLL